MLQDGLTYLAVRQRDRRGKVDRLQLWPSVVALRPAKFHRTFIAVRTVGPGNTDIFSVLSGFEVNFLLSASRFVLDAGLCEPIGIPGDIPYVAEV